MRLNTAKNLSPLFLDTFCPSSVLLYNFSTIGSACCNKTFINSVKKTANNSPNRYQKVSEIVDGLQSVPPSSHVDL